MESILSNVSETISISDYILSQNNQSLSIMGKFDLNSQFKFDIKIESNVTFSFSTTTDLPNPQAIIKLSSNELERIYGLGEQFSKFNLKSNRIPILTREQGVGRGLEPLSSIVNKADPNAAGDAFSTYTAVPYFCTSDCRGLLIKTSEISFFDFTNINVIEIQVYGTEINGILFNASSHLDLCEQYTAICGRMNILPKWTGSGVILGLQGGEERVLEIVDKMIESGVALSAVWLQDWCGRRLQPLPTMTLSRLWWNWESDDVLYPNWISFVSKLKDRGIQVLSYVNPMLSDTKTKPKTRTNYYQKALEDGHFVMNSDNSGPELIESFAGLLAGQIDLTSQSAIDFIKTIIKTEILSTGVAGYMCDFGEYLPFNSTLSSSHPSISFHNEYPHEWSRINREAITESNLDVIFFSRSAWYKTPSTTPLFWVGDQIPTFDKHDGLHSAILAQLSSGVCGFTLSSSDIGGYNCVITPEIKIVRTRALLWRWMEVGCFGAVWRSHEGNVPSEHHQLYSDDKTIEFLSYISNLFVSLDSYRIRLMKLAQEKGYPLMRPLFMEFKDCLEVDDQFMFGDALLVCPVLEPDVLKRSVYLPSGSKWMHVWSRKEYEGGVEVEIEAGFGYIPIFLKDGVEDGLETFLKFEAKIFD